MFESYDGEIPDTYFICLDKDEYQTALFIINEVQEYIKTGSKFFPEKYSLLGSLDETLETLAVKLKKYVEDVACIELTTEEIKALMIADDAVSDNLNRIIEAFQNKGYFDGVATQIIETVLMVTFKIHALLLHIMICKSNTAENAWNIYKLDKVLDEI